VLMEQQSTINRNMPFWLPWRVCLRTSLRTRAPYTGRRW
jgi:hypothetical protein